MKLIGYCVRKLKHAVKGKNLSDCVKIHYLKKLLNFTKFSKEHLNVQALSKRITPNKAIELYL